jgi:pimeloyl-ACP methyl ester carboxylesterase
MTALWLVLCLLLAMAALSGFSYAAAHRIEAITPPQGGFLEIGGQRLHVLDKGAGPPLVLIHGLSGQMGNFTHSLVGRLVPDFRVVAFDRPGSGYSTRAAGSSAGLEAQAATLVEAIGRLKLDKPVVVGHSLGGAVALAIALNHPGCAGAIALIAPLTHPVRTPPLVFRELAIRSPLLRLLVAWTVATPGGLLLRNFAAREVFAPEPAPADFASAGGGLLSLRPRNIAEASADMTAVNAGLKIMTPRYASIDVPVGVLYGRGDHLLNPVAQGESMKQLLPSVDLEIVEGGHMLPVTQPDLCAAFIRRIWAKTSAAAAGR